MIKDKVKNLTSKMEIGDNKKKIENLEYRRNDELQT